MFHVSQTFFFFPGIFPGCSRSFFFIINGAGRRGGAERLNRSAP